MSASPSLASGKLDERSAESVGWGREEGRGRKEGRWGGGREQNSMREEWVGATECVAGKMDAGGEGQNHVGGTGEKGEGR